VGGGIMMGFILTTYSHFLAPVGLPNASFRLLAENPPPAAVHWLSYRQEFLVILPLTLIVGIVAYLVALWWRRSHSPPASYGEDRVGVVSAVAVSIALAALGIVTAIYTGPEGNEAIVSSTGRGSLQTGTSYDGDLIPAAATLRMAVENRNTHRTPLPPHDRVSIDATVHSPDGAVYEIQAKEPMVADPLGRFTTWSGVGFSVWHHGRSGIGSPNLPPVHSNVAVFALGNITSNGRMIAAGVPTHVMTTARNGGRLELHVGDAQFPLPEIPNGHLRVIWPDYEGGHSKSIAYARYGWGGGILIALLGFAVAAARRQPRHILLA
jgi:hypothetical protein